MRDSHRLHDEAGFTLIELLVVILIVGILAAIALPAFLGQRVKAADSEAKSNARNLVSQLESCWPREESYIGCTLELDSNASGLPIGTGAGTVRIVSEAQTSYVVSATSEANTGGGPHVFTITHTLGESIVRTCTPVNQGGCKPDGTW